MAEALIVWGGWEGHQPKQCAERFAPLLEAAGLKARVSDTLDVLLDADYLMSLTLFVPIWTMGRISKDQERNILAAVRGGVHIGGWHGGMGDSFRDSVGWQFLVGGQWVAHPGGVIPYRVRISDADHPITRGLPDFDLVSEQYYMHVDPSNRVLADTCFAGDREGIDWIRGCRMPVAWTRRYGAGRVFYASIGHVAADFDVEPARELVRRGLVWAAYGN
jgi:hypothetical protein